MEQSSPKAESDGKAESVPEWKSNMERQMNVWRSDPHWDDQPPKIEVSVPKDAFINMQCDCLLALPPDEAFNILCDPDNRRVFKNVKGVISREVLEDDGDRQVVELEQLAIWRFLFLSGTFSVKLKVIQDRKNYSMSFNLSQPGFMKHFKGYWKLEPHPVPPSHLVTTHSSHHSQSARPGSTVSPEPWGLVHTASISRAQTSSILNILNNSNRDVVAQGPSVPWYGPGTRVATIAKIEQEVSPVVTPPPFLASYLRGISANTTFEVLRDFQIEAARLRYSLPDDSDFKRELRKIAVEEGEAEDGAGKETRRTHRRTLRRGHGKRGARRLD